MHTAVGVHCTRITVHIWCDCLLIFARSSKTKKSKNHFHCVSYHWFVTRKKYLYSVWRAHSNVDAEICIIAHTVTPLSILLLLKTLLTLFPKIDDWKKVNELFGLASIHSFLATKKLVFIKFKPCSKQLIPSSCFLITAMIAGWQ